MRPDEVSLAQGPRWEAGNPGSRFLGEGISEAYRRCSFVARSRAAGVSRPRALHKVPSSLVSRRTGLGGASRRGASTLLPALVVKPEECRDICIKLRCSLGGLKRQFPALGKRLVLLHLAAEVSTALA